MKTKNIFIALALMVAAVLLSAPMASAQNLTPKVNPKNGLYGYWGTKNNGNEAFVIKPKFDKAERFVNGHAFVSVNGAWYVIGNDGKALSSTTYSDAYALGNNHYRVCQGDKYGVVDLYNLATILPVKYDAIDNLDGKYKLKINGKVGLADRSGSEILPIMYDAISAFDGKYKLKINGKLGLADRSGSEILPIMYDAISAFDGKYKLKINGKLGLVDKSGSEILPVKYDKIDTYDGKYKLTIDGKQGLADKSGTEILPVMYDAIWICDDKYELTIDGKHGLADQSGTEILPVRYDAISVLDTNAYKVAIGDKYGIVDKTNKVIVEPQYKAIECVAGGLYALFSDKWIFVDSSGRAVDISDRVMHYATNNGQKIAKHSANQNLFCDGVGVLVFTNVIEPEQWINFLMGFANVNRINGKEIISDGGLKILGDKLVCVDRGLSSVSIPATVKSIHPKAFVGCEYIENVNVADLNLWLRSGVDMSSSDGWSLYHNGKLVTNVTIPNGVTEIARGQFCDNKSLTSITIPASVKEIGELAFYGCSSLTIVTISNGVTSIGEKAFINCTSLYSITIPTSVTTIGNNAFYGCSSLGSITIPASVKEIGESAFEDCRSLTNVTISNGVTSIGEKAFNNCTSLYSVTIGNSVTSIGNEAFKGCSSLSSITIPASVTYIGIDAFMRHEDWGTFYIYMKGATPPALGEMFKNLYRDMITDNSWYVRTTYDVDVIIYVPESALFNYRTADMWKGIADRIYPMY